MEVGEQARERFTRLFAAHYWSVVGYLVRRHPDEQAARDGAAEVFTIAWRKLAEVPDDALPWLYATARNVQANAVRAQGRQARLRRRLAQQRTPASEAPDLDHVGVALGKLAPGDQEVLRLAAWEELSTTQIATVLGCTPNAAGVRLHRARARLRAVLAEFDQTAQMENSSHER